MTNAELGKEITAKYGRIFHYTFFANKQAFLKYAEQYEDLFIASEWKEFGVTLVELGDNNMWNEIVVILDDY